MTRNGPTPTHIRNIVAKARRALDAIDSLITTRLLDDPDLDLADLQTGRRFVYNALMDGDVVSQAGWWVAIGIEHDRLNGVTGYRTAADITMFDTSRDLVLDGLERRMAETARVDPFAGLVR